ncbi:MAG: site-specific integrase, partial [Halobacteriaceae archaeon]
SSHNLRATGLTFCADLGVDAKTLRDFAGWEDIQTSVRYLRLSGHIITHKLYAIAGKEDEAPAVIPPEPSEKFPLVLNPVPFQREPFDPLSPDGEVAFDEQMRRERHREQRDETIPLIHPRGPNLPNNRRIFPDGAEQKYQPLDHKIPGHISTDSDRIKVEHERYLLKANPQ